METSDSEKPEWGIKARFILHRIYFLYVSLSINVAGFERENIKSRKLDVSSEDRIAKPNFCISSASEAF